jgi:hypothetical protein
MIVTICQPSPLLTRDSYSLSKLADHTKLHLSKYSPNYSLVRNSHKVTINFANPEDAILFKLTFSESLT